MSIRCMAEVWAVSKAEGPGLLLMLAIADYARDDGTGAYPSLATLAKKTRMDRRRVIRITKLLELSGELTVDRKGSKWGTNEYAIVLGSDILTPEQVDDEKAGSGLGDTSTGGLGDTRVVVRVTPDTLLNRHESQEAADAASPGRFERPDHVPNRMAGIARALAGAADRAVTDDFLEIQEYPEDLRPVLRAMVETFPVPVPEFRSSKGKFWAGEARAMAVALQGFDMAEVFGRVKDRTGKAREHIPIQGPQSLYAFVADEIRVMRTERQTNRKPKQWVTLGDGGNE